MASDPSRPARTSDRSPPAAAAAAVCGDRTSRSRSSRPTSGSATPSLAAPPGRRHDQLIRVLLGLSPMSSRYAFHGLVPHALRPAPSSQSAETARAHADATRPAGASPLTRTVASRRETRDEVGRIDPAGRPEMPSPSRSAESARAREWWCHPRPRDRVRSRPRREPRRDGRGRGRRSACARGSRWWLQLRTTVGAHRIEGGALVAAQAGDVERGRPLPSPA